MSICNISAGDIVIQGGAVYPVDDCSSAFVPLVRGEFDGWTRYILCSLYALELISAGREHRR